MVGQVYSGKVFRSNGKISVKIVWTHKSLIKFA